MLFVFTGNTRKVELSKEVRTGLLEALEAIRVKRVGWRALAVLVKRSRTSMGVHREGALGGSPSSSEQVCSDQRGPTESAQSRFCKRNRHTPNCAPHRNGNKASWTKGILTGRIYDRRLQVGNAGLFRLRGGCCFEWAPSENQKNRTESFPHSENFAENAWCLSDADYLSSFPNVADRYLKK